MAVMLGMAALIAVSSTLTVDEAAEERFDALFGRALASFALARALNGIISVVQGTEVAVAPAGVGVTLTPGEILDPVNDLVERFSWIMLAATVSLGIQQVMLDVGQWWGLRASVAAAGIAWLLLWLAEKQSRSERVRLFLRGVSGIFVILLFLRFAVPVALVLNEWAYELFLETRYTESVAGLESAGEALERSVPETPAGEEQESGGIGSILGRAWDATKSRLDFDRRLGEIERRAAEVVTHVVRLIVVFVLQTAVLPLIFLWLLLVLAKFLFFRRQGVELRNE